MPDGAVVISTRLDNSRIPKDAASLQRALEKISTGIKQAFHGREIRQLRQDISATRDAMQPIAKELAAIEAKAAGADKKQAAGFERAAAKAQELQGQYDALLDKITEYENAKQAKYGLGGITDKSFAASAQAAYQKDLQGDAGYRKMIAEAEALKQKIVEVTAALPAMKQAAVDAAGTSSARYRQLKEELGGLTERLDEYGQRLQTLGADSSVAEGGLAKLAGMAGTLNNAMGGIAQGIKSAFSALKKLGGVIGSVFKKGATLVKKFAAHLRLSSNGAQSLGTRLRSIVAGALVFNGISAALRRMTSYLGNAIMASGQMQSAMANLKGAAATAAAPIIGVLTPALAALANAAATVFYYIAKLISLITGRSIGSMQGAAKAMGGVSSAAGGAAKNIQKATKSLMAFDELNTLSAQPDDNGGGGGGGGASALPNYDFTGSSPFLDSLLDAIKQGDYYKVGALLAEKLNDSLAGINWDKIQSTVHGWATNIYNMLNGFVDNPELPLTIGHTIAQGLNTAIDFVDTIAQNFHWETLGQNIGSGLNQAFQELNWEGLGRVLTDGLRGALLTLHGFLQTFDWVAFGHDLMRMISSAVANINWVQAAHDFGQLAIGVLQALNAALSDVDWGEVSKTIGRMLAAVDWGGILKQLAELFGHLLEGAFSTGLGYLLLPTVTSKIGSVIGAIIGAFSPLGPLLGPQIGGAIGTAVGAAVGVVIDLCIGLGKWLAGHWEGLKQGWSNFWAGIGGKLDEWKTAISGKWDEMKQKASDTWTQAQESIATTWNNIQSTVSQKVTELGTKLSTEWDNIKTQASSSWEGIKKMISDTWDNIKEKSSATWDAVKEGVGAAWASIRDGLKEKINAIIGFMNRLLTGAANMVNGLIDILNRFSIDVPKGVPGIGGTHFGFNLSHVSAPQIPLLAQGAVIPANREFMAVLGDQKNGRNLEAPEGLLRQIVREELARNEQLSTGVETLQPINVYLGSDLLDSFIVSAQRRQALRSGGR